MLYVKCKNGQPVVSLTKPDDSWIEVDATLSDKIICKDGKPVVITSLTYEKQQLIENLKQQLSNYILSFYPLQKQQYDLTKKDFWVSWLLVRRNDLTVDKIGQIAYDDAAKILSGQSTFQEIVATYPSTIYTWNGMQVPESLAWEEILKVSVRIGWIKICTTQLDLIEKQIMQATSLDKFRNLDITQKLPPWPNI